MGVAHATDLSDAQGGPQDLLTLKQGDHLCLVYDDDPTEQFAALIPFLKQGLENGERGVYVCDDTTMDSLSAALAGDGVDVDGAISSGALIIWTREQWRPAGELVSAEMAARVDDVIRQALAEGFCGIRFAIEMTWTLDPNIASDRLCHWEATLNTVIRPDVPARMICQYSRKRLGPEVVYAGLATHPVAVLGTETLPNPYHRGPLALHDPATPSVGHEDIDWMLSQLRWQRAYESERARRLRAEETAAEAEASLQQLREANATKDDLLALLSHELRTPLTIVSGFAEYLARKGDGYSPESALAVQEITLGAQRLTRIITNLLLLGQDDAGAAEGEPIVLKPILRVVMAEHKKRHPEREISVHHESPHTPALGNAVYAEQVIANLVANAEKYSPAGTLIEIRLSLLDGYRVVSVLDRGIGFPPGEAERLFEAFYRSAEAARVGGGLGVGLFVCKRVVEAQGGKIWCLPRPGGGSEFSFTLPLAEE